MSLKCIRNHKIKKVFLLNKQRAEMKLRKPEKFTIKKSNHRRRRRRKKLLQFPIWEKLNQCYIKENPKEGQDRL